MTAEEAAQLAALATQQQHASRGARSLVVRGLIREKYQALRAAGASDQARI